MSNPDPPTSSDDFAWQLLTEFLIPARQDVGTQVVEHIAAILHQTGLEPGLLNQILSAIDQSMQNLEGNDTPLHLRISVSGVDLEEVGPASSLDRPRDLELAGRGLGFFAVKRLVGQLQARDAEKYRLLEVLIYRE